MTDELVLDAQDIWVAVRVDGVVRPIVQGARLQVPRGRIVGLVGESGSGKTQLVRSILGLSSLEPGLFAGRSTWRLGAEPGLDVLEGIESASPFRAPLAGELLPQRQRVGWGWPLWRRRFHKRLASLRSAGVGFIFQNPLGALNPYLTVGAQLLEAVRVARPQATGQEATEGALHWLAEVHLEAAERTLALYPHELSGGMAQRVMIALALAAEPRFLIADEPTTGLDSHIRREVVGLLHRILAGGRLSGVVISHDLPMVSRLCDRLTVMFRGRVVEEGPIEALDDGSAPNHPYTRELRERAEDLTLGRHGRSRAADASPDGTGSVVMPGCAYRARCLVYRGGLVSAARCEGEVPPLIPRAAGHDVACHVGNSDVLSDLAAVSAAWRGEDLVG